MLCCFSCFTCFTRLITICWSCELILYLNWQNLMFLMMTDKSNNSHSNINLSFCQLNPNFSSISNDSGWLLNRFDSFLTLSDLCTNKFKCTCWYYDGSIKHMLYIMYILESFILWIITKCFKNTKDYLFIILAISHMHQSPSKTCACVVTWKLHNIY